MKKIVLAAILLLPLPFVFAEEFGITVSNGIAKVSWSLTNYYSLLQSSTNLTTSNSWSNVGSASPIAATFSGSAWLTNYDDSTGFVTQRVTTARQFFRLKNTPLIPIFSFAIFYEQLLEFTGSAPMVMNGLVHANGPIYVGAVSGSSQTFNGSVTTAGTISSPANGGYASNILTGLVAFNGKPPLITNLPPLVWFGGTNDRHAIIEIPPAGENVNLPLGQMRLYNQARLILLVTNSPWGGGPMVKVIMQTPFNGSLPANDIAKIVRVMTNVTDAFLQTNSSLVLPFLSLTNTFVDQRQDAAKKQFVTQVDMIRLNDWLLTNAISAGKFTGGNKPTILYVADQRNIGSTTQAVVRLTRATKVPENGGLGFTVATQNPLYVWGNYNITVNSNTYATTVGSTTNGACVPAALIADAITILSPNWLDAASGGSYTIRSAANMTVNAAFLCGNVPSTGITSTTYSGGVHNLTRFLEDWSGDSLTYNTSLVCLFASQMATNQYRLSGVYSFPPTRLWGFDVNFNSPNKLPPGTPVYGLP